MGPPKLARARAFLSSVLQFRIAGQPKAGLPLYSPSA
jgi:hypothetical protein